MNKIDSIPLEKDSLMTYHLGYKQLDSILDGIEEGSIVTIGARPAMGKSLFMNNIVLNLLESYNLPTLFINLETMKEHVMINLSTILSEKSTFEVEDKTNLVDKNYNLYISDDCRYINDLETLMEQNPDIKFIVIDYIQLMDSEKEFSNHTDSVNDVLERLRNLANQYKVVIFLLSQISRSVEYRMDNRPILADLSGSSNLGYISDIVLLLYRDNYYNSKVKDTTTEIIISKNRYGAVGITHLDYDKEKSRFIDY